MNFIENETPQKLRGGFYTETGIADFLSRWVLDIKPKSLLEPCCGDGAFLDSVFRLKNSALNYVFACEMDPEEAGKAKRRVSRPGKIAAEILTTDFLSWFLLHSHEVNTFDAVLGNPPFIRYQYLDDRQQYFSEKIFARFGLPFTKHTNAWVPFVIASLSLLSPGGRLGMVIPAEIFHIPHAQSLRTFLSTHCSRILIVDPEELWFDDALQGVVLLLAEKKVASSEKSYGVAVQPAKSREFLSENARDYFEKAAYINGVTIEGKWMPVFLSAGERALLAQLRTRNNVKKFAEIASVDVGIVTGANKFFLVPDNIVEEFSLQRWAHPMFGRSDHVQGLVYSEKDHHTNRKTGLPTNFLWFQEEEFEALPSNARRYLNIGLSQKLHTRFKCRTRKVWYKVPSVYSAPIAMLKRAHHYPRLVLNSVGAYTTDTAYRIRPLGIKLEALVLGFVNSLTCLMAEMEGRHYGGGVLELVPSEIERLLVPIITATRADLDAADRRFRSTKDDSAFLRMQDALVLGKIGLTKTEQETLHSAWLKLRDRRHRLPSSDESEEASLNANRSRS